MENYLKIGEGEREGKGSPVVGLIIPFLKEDVLFVFWEEHRSAKENIHILESILEDIFPRKETHWPMIGQHYTVVRVRPATFGRRDYVFFESSNKAIFTQRNPDGEKKIGSWLKAITSLH